MYHVVYSQYYNFDIAQLFVQKQLTQWTLVQQCLPPPHILCCFILVQTLFCPMLDFTEADSNHCVYTVASAKSNMALLST